MATLANYRFQAIDDFKSLRRRANWSRWWSALRQQETGLLSFAALKPLLQQGRYRGVREIPLKAIVGSVDRVDDFDRHFRPRYNAASRRWIDIYILAHSQGWPPIEVHKIGNLYFVEDGHHRVSVARHLNSPSIEAIVWDYNVAVEFDRSSSLAEVKARLKQFLCPDPCCLRCDSLPPALPC